MITYTEKGAAMHAAIRAAGHSLAQVNGVWVSDNDTAVKAIITAFDPLAAAIAAQKSALDAFAATKRSASGVYPSPLETSRWQEKYRQAKAYKATPVDPSAPDVAAEALARGVTTDALATMIIAKGDSLAAKEAAIAGLAGKYADTISAMTVWQSVLAYDFTTGWP